jgi:hypothetical protein
MSDFPVNLTIHLIFLVIRKDSVFSNETVLLHIPESLIKAVIRNDGIDKGLHTKLLSSDVHCRIQLNGLNRIRIKADNFLT